MARRAARPATGVPLGEAYKLVAQEPELSEFEALAKEGRWPRFVWTLGGRESEGERLADRADSLRQGFDDTVLEQLRSGALTATARDTRLPVSSGRLTIPVDAWQFIEVNFYQEKAKADGHELLDVRIRHANPRAASILLERNVEHWIRAMAGASEAKPKKRDVEKLALEKFPDLSDRIFERAWDAAAPDWWKQAGRPKSPQ